MNRYLFFAYSLVWLVFILYAWILSLRQARLHRDLDEVKSRLEGKLASPPRPTLRS